MAEMWSVDPKTLTNSSFFRLITTVPLLGKKGCDTQMVIHSSTYTADVSLSQLLQKHFSSAALKHGVGKITTLYPPV